jgi:hypothetical protein
LGDLFGISRLRVVDDDTFHEILLLLWFERV